jgi:flagellar L-ring protein FlgH
MACKPTSPHASRLRWTDRARQEPSAASRRLGPAMKRFALLAMATTWGVTADAMAQNSSLFQRALPASESSPLSLQQGSWTYIPPPPPKKLEIHDVVVVRVDEMARMQAEGDMQRRKDATYDAYLKDWVFLEGLKAIRPSLQDGQPRARGQLQQLFRAEGDMQTRESLTLNIACSIVDILPNGNLVLEGHKQICVNDESWQISLSGVCRREDIAPDGTVLSRHVVDLKLDKRDRGHVRDSYKRGWFVRLFDQFHPF